MRRVAILGAVLAMVTGLVGGCADIGQEPTAPQSLPQGLTVLDTSDTSIAIAYRNADVVIYFEALRGRPTPDMYQQNPLAPKYEVDARFIADNGRIFFSQRGGDNWIDPTWAEDLERQNDMSPSRVSNRLLFDMAAEAAQSLDGEVVMQVGTKGAASLQPAINALRAIGTQAPATFALMKVRMQERLSTQGIPERVEIPYGSDTGGPDAEDISMGANAYALEMHTDSTYVIAEHSATRLYSWSGEWLFAHDSCNHGRCPYIEGMSPKCVVQYDEALEDWKPTWTLQSCHTDYNAFSNDGHNCHDDTRMQMASFVYGNESYQVPANSRWCNDDDGSADISAWPGDMGGSPECNPTSSRGYNYPSQCDYNYDFPYNCSESWKGTDDGCDCGCLWDDGTGADPDCR